MSDENVASGRGRRASTAETTIQVLLVFLCVGVAVPFARAVVWPTQPVLVDPLRDRVTDFDTAFVDTSSSIRLLVPGPSGTLALTEFVVREPQGLTFVRDVPPDGSDHAVGDVYPIDGFARVDGQLVNVYAGRYERLVVHLKATDEIRGGVVPRMGKTTPAHPVETLR